MSDKTPFKLSMDRDALFKFIAEADSADEAMSTIGHRLVGALLANGEDWKDHVLFDLVGIKLEPDTSVSVSKEYVEAANEMAKTLNRFLDPDDMDDIVFKLDDAKHDLKEFNKHAGVQDNDEDPEPVAPKP
ncbi:hypothetical protein [Sulfitobacter sp. R18_1]|uniref:hypothetical protein n=1 Tax=Sulfitobacter sp. R18_1 TaxID=2821104 RepID=UPI001ADAA4B8|nr:hypothetical protein [Sulfitobacter sp. R18_1]MBO9428320.1 hypothetical protein [Sulfitobacter sp. R18_1]